MKGKSILQAALLAHSAVFASKNVGTIDHVIFDEAHHMPKRKPTRNQLKAKRRKDKGK